MLQALPDAMFWLPAYPPAAQRNLLAAAHKAGIDAARLLFQPCGSHAQQLADLLVDGVRFNANQGLVDALRKAVPTAVRCRVPRARMGGCLDHDGKASPGGTASGGFRRGAGDAAPTRR